MARPAGDDWLQVLLHLLECLPGGDNDTHIRRTGLLIAAVCAVGGMGYGAWWLVARPQDDNFDIPLYGFAAFTLFGLALAGYGWWREGGE